MHDRKALAIESISAAEAELKQALGHLEALPTFESNNILLAAHALKNYMSVISGTVDLLSLRLRGRIEEEDFALIENLGHSNELMRQTLNRLTHTSPIDDVSFIHKRVDFLRLVDLAGEYYRKVAAKKHIRIHVEKTASFRYAWTDAAATAAVLDNLLSNAVKYSPPQKNVWLSVTDRDNFFVCAVRDEGPGIRAADQPQLFGRGVTLGHVPTGNEPSTGYGLAVARELAEKLGGAIDVESREGEGATFSFRLPVSMAC